MNGSLPLGVIGNRIKIILPVWGFLKIVLLPPGGWRWIEGRMCEHMNSFSLDFAETNLVNVEFNIKFHVSIVNLRP